MKLKYFSYKPVLKDNNINNICQSLIYVNF